MRVTESKILAVLKQLVQKESFSCYRGYSSENTRDYPCKVAGCINKAYAKSFCNAHYMRNRDGRDLKVPIQNRQREGRCLECCNPTNMHGGWGRCRRCYKSRRYALIKTALVGLFGSRCSDCKKVYPIYVFDFHHVKVKEMELDFTGLSLLKISHEVAKCILLCANCHRERTHGRCNNRN